MRIPTNIFRKALGTLILKFLFCSRRHKRGDVNVYLLWNGSPIAARRALPGDALLCCGLEAQGSITTCVQRLAACVSSFECATLAVGELRSQCAPGLGVLRGCVAIVAESKLEGAARAELFFGQSLLSGTVRPSALDQ